MNTSNSKTDSLMAKLSRLRTILAGQSDASGYLETFDEFIAEHEFGLALHAVCDYLLEQGGDVQSPLIEEIGSLHQMMEIEDDCVDQLRLRVTKA